MESLADLKELRESAEVNQETAAEWIGVVRSTYTRKEKGDLPTAFAEYALVKLRLELILESRKGVVPPCGILDSSRVESICQKIGVIYQSGNLAAINSTECHLEGVVAMLTGQEQVGEILNSLNVLMNANHDFHRRMDDIQSDLSTLKKSRAEYDKKLKEIKELVKSETPDEKSAVEEIKEGIAAVKSSDSR